MNICIIAPGYPDEKRSVFTFVKQLVDEMASQGHVCYVIAPYSVTHNKRWNRKTTEHIDFPEGGKVVIYRPNIITLSTLKICGFEPSRWAFQRATNRVLNKLRGKIDCIYGHFWASALAGFRYAKKNNIPLFVATGESVIPQYMANNRYSDFYEYVSGVICVSSKNLEESVLKGLTTRDKCKVIPNAINPHVFRLLNKKECRRQLNIPMDAFVVISVGWFSERKGTKRISQAIDLIQDGSIYSIFIGKGTEEPTCDNILFKGPVPHDQIPIYLNASDVFVLPTLHEGCCNAVIEAMACGLPIISSDLSFNHDILNHKNSILINPTSIQEIRKGIEKIYNNEEYRDFLAKKSLESANSLTIKKRAMNIIEFIETKI